MGNTEDITEESDSWFQMALIMLNVYGFLNCAEETSQREKKRKGKTQSNQKSFFLKKKKPTTIKTCKMMKVINK